MRFGRMETANPGIEAVKIRILLSLIILLLFPVSSSAAEESLNISSDYLEYISKDNTYLGRGNVRILYGDLTLLADEVRFNNLTTEAMASGNVIYESREMTVTADKLELNLESRLGTIYNSYILYKKKNYHIRGGDLKKTGPESYRLDHATVTTCNASPPEWYISAKDINAVEHQKLTLRDAKFYINDVPVFYTPYFSIPLLGKRQTGVLNPALGYTNTKGFTYKQGFFWAPKDNRDATLYLDYFSNKGFGTGLDYRYITGPDTFGEIWAYHLSDNDIERNFTEVKSYHNHKLPYNISAYLKVHAVNEFDYYEILDSTSPDRFGLTYMEPALFGFSSDERQQKYLESNLQFSKPFSGSRAYLLAQYKQNLEGSSGAIPQNLPELGFILNTKKMGAVSYNMSLMATNFWREEGQTGQRIDLNPNLYLSFGRMVNLTQKIGLRETAYFLKAPDRNENRAIFDLNTSISTRFLKKFPSFNHIIEPVLEYTFIPAVDHDGIPTFDSTDSIPQTSTLTYSLTNRLAGSSSARFRLSQGYSLLSTDEPFTPVLAEGTFSNDRINFSINASYDVYAKNIIDTIASLYLFHKKGFIGFGKNFRRSTLLDQYSVDAGLYSPIEMYGISIPLKISGNMWYDLKGGGVQELNLKSTYQRQCWGFTISYIKKPYEYEIMFGIEFTGLGTLQLI